jgi:hypothetical protein
MPLRRMLAGVHRAKDHQFRQSAARELKMQQDPQLPEMSLASMTAAIK